MKIKAMHTNIWVYFTQNIVPEELLNVAVFLLVRFSVGTYSIFIFNWIRHIIEKVAYHSFF